MRIWLASFAAFFLLAAGFATPARASQDVVHFGSTIDIGPNDTVHDAICFFCSVNIHGTLNHDAVVFFGDVRIDGHAQHDVVNFFGSTRVADESSIGQDVVNFFGSVRLGQNASIGKNTVVMFGSLHSEPTASFGGDRVVQPGWLFWGPILFLGLGISFIVREVRGAQRRRILRGY